MSGLIVAFMRFDAIPKLIEKAPAVEATQKLGYPATAVRPMGIALLVCTLLYAIPPTAILLTGYLGGAVATHVRAQTGTFPILFSVAFGGLVWLGPVLRDPRLFSLVLKWRWPVEKP